MSQSSPQFVDDDRCFGCGNLNKNGLKLSFGSPIGSKLKTSWTPKSFHQGYKGVVHGGLIGLVFDELAVNHVLKLGVEAVSAEISIRLKAAAGIGEALDFESVILKKTRKLIRVEAVCTRKGALIAEAAVTCVIINPSAI